MLTDLQYVKIVRFLECVKIVHGNEFLIATLRRHKRLLLALIILQLILFIKYTKLIVNNR